MPKDDEGFDQFPTLEDGWKALQRQVALDANRGMTVKQFVTKYAPPIENDTEGYISRLIANFKTATPDTPLKTITKSMGVDKVAEAIAKIETPAFDPSLGYSLQKQKSLSSPAQSANIEKSSNIERDSTLSYSLDRNVKLPLPVKEVLNKVVSEDNSLSLNQKVTLVANGIKRYSGKVLQNVSSIIDEMIKDKPGVDSTVIKAQKKEAEERLKLLIDKKYQELKLKKIQDWENNSAPSKRWDEYNLNKLKFGYRNRGYKPEVSTDAVLLQLLNPVTDNINDIKNVRDSQQIIALNTKTGKVEFPSSADSIKNSYEYVYSWANKFKVTDFDVNRKTKDIWNGTGTYFPTLLDKEGNPITYAVGAAYDNNNLTQGMYGGKLLLISEDGKYKRLYVGSVSKLQKNFYDFKRNTGSKEVTVVQLDEGSYNFPSIPDDAHMNYNDWENYDAQNVVGGHAFYIKN